MRLHDWAWNPHPDRQQFRAVHAVTNKTINIGCWTSPVTTIRTGVPSRRPHPLLTGLRHKSDKKWRCEYHTPPPFADVMARVLVDEDFAEPGKSIYEPAVGSGMLRSIVQRLRELKRNPYDYTA